jgi:hypothetical protein
MYKTWFKKEGCKYTSTNKACEEGQETNHIW